jgi:hypothetical protein
LVALTPTAGGLLLGDLFRAGNGTLKRQSQADYPRQVAISISLPSGSSR